MKEAIINRIPFLREAVAFSQSKLIGLGLVDEPELEGSPIPIRLWGRCQRFSGASQVILEARKQAIASEQEAKRRYYSPRENHSESEAAYADWKNKEKETNSYWDKYREATKPLVQVHRDLSQYLITRHWGTLTVMERRAVDISAEDNLNGRIIYDVIDNLTKGLHLPDEGNYVRTHVNLDDHLIPPEWVCNEIYGYYSMNDKRALDPTAIHVLGLESFALQRTMFHFTPIILPRALAKIPESNSINQRAVTSYLQEVIGRGKAHVLDSDGIRLSLEPHLEHPYTDSEWVAGLEKQRETAPTIARTLLEECSNLMAVTMYGPVTRTNRNFVMFHPHGGLSLGAFFYEKDMHQINRAVILSQELGEKYGVQIRPGTEHAGVFGGGFYTWHFSTPEDIRKYLTGLDTQANPHMNDSYVNRLTEIAMQVLDGTPLAIRNQTDFVNALSPLKRFRKQYFEPIFRRVRFLFEHFERDYPFPVESKGRYK